MKEAAKHLRLCVTRFLADRASFADIEEAMTMLDEAVWHTTKKAEKDAE